MIVKNLQDKEWYDVRIVGLRKIELGQNGTQALEVVVRFADDSQASTNLFLTPKSLPNTRKRLEALGATEADLTGGDWLRKLTCRFRHLAGAGSRPVFEERLWKSSEQS